MAYIEAEEFQRCTMRSSIARSPREDYSRPNVEKQVPMPQATMNKSSRFLALAVVGGLIVWLGVLQVRLARRERERLQLQAAHQELLTQHRQATDEIGILRRQLSMQPTDVAEVAGLRAQAVKTGRQSRTEAGVMPDPSGGMKAAGKDSPPLWPLSAGVEAAIGQRFGPLAIQEVQPSLHEGKPVYIVHGTTGDGRSVGVMIAPDGAVVTSKSELLADALPEQIAGAIRELGGHTTIEKAREIYSPEGGLEYALSGQSEDGRKVSLNICADGRIASGEVERSASDLPEPVRSTVAQTVADRSPSSVRQVFGGKGTFYEIGFGGDTERIHIVIDDLGRLVSFVSKVDFPPDQPVEKPKP